MHLKLKVPISTIRTQIHILGQDQLFDICTQGQMVENNLHSSIDPQSSCWSQSQLYVRIRCVQEFLCLRGAQGEHIFDVSRTVKLSCSYSACSQSRFMHKDCFETWQETLLNVLTSSREAQKKVRNWSEKQKVQYLWKQGYGLVSAHCGCRCEEGNLRKDLNWVPLRSSSSGNSGEKKHYPSV